MMHRALETVNARPVGDVTLGRKAGADDQVLRFGCAAVCGLYMPASLVSGELGLSNDALKSGVGFDVENFVAGVEVISEIMVVGVVVGPVVAASRQ